MENIKENCKKKVVVGLSGGVDSAVSVIKLLEQGYEVEGMFMRNWDSSINNDVLGNPHTNDSVCPQEVDYMDALVTAKELGIKLHRVDFVSEYWDYVFSYFLSEYKKYRTPNPDILCNKEIKFKAFLNKAMEMGFDYIAMGHYARITHDPLRIYKGIDSNKDQTYFLSQLSLEQLDKALFPVGDLTKPEVRKIAMENGLKIAKKKDSTGVCFIGERNFKKFLENYLPAQQGNMETLDGEVVGVHDGLMYYTIGQRHGLALGGEGDAWFVLGKDIKRNVLLVGRGENQEYLYSNRCLVSNINWIAPDILLNKDGSNELNCQVKFRYRSMDIPATIRYVGPDCIEINYPSKFKAVTPGQAAVFYLEDRMLGGSTIDEVYMDLDKRRY